MARLSNSEIEKIIDFLKKGVSFPEDYRVRQSLGEDMAIAIRGSERRIEDFKSELKKTLDRFEEEDLVIERNPELFSAAIVVARDKS